MLDRSGLYTESKVKKGYANLSNSFQSLQNWKELESFWISKQGITGRYLSFR